MEIKNVYVVDGKEFTDESSASYYKELQSARKAYHESAKQYEEVLNSCLCQDLQLDRKVNRDYGKPYEDEFENWHKDRILVQEYSCRCCRKMWSYADFNGEGFSWKSDGKILVKRGVF